MKDFPVRKEIRLEGRDYSEVGYYYITICVKDRRELLWEANHAGTIFGSPPLSIAGFLVDAEINRIDNIYNNVKIDKYVIMPDHIHMIIRLSDAWDIDGQPKATPTISRIINKFKGSISKNLGYSIWQKLFFDRIIRNEIEYQAIWQYINENPANWQEDQHLQIAEINKEDICNGKSYYTRDGNPPHTDCGRKGIENQQEENNER